MKYEEPPTPIKERIFPSSQDLKIYRNFKKEEVISYERYKIDIEQNSLNQAFRVADLEEATDSELQDVKLLVPLIFTEFSTSASRSRREREYSTEDTSLTNVRTKTALF